MKKYSLLLFLLLFTSVGMFSQYYTKNYSFDSRHFLYRNEIYNQIKQIKTNKVNQLKIYELKDKKKVLTSEIQLDSAFEIVYSAVDLDERKPYIRTNTKVNNKQIATSIFSKWYSYSIVSEYHKTDSNTYLLLNSMSLTGSKKNGRTQIFRNSEHQIDSVYFFRKNRNTFNTKYIYAYKNDKLFELKEYNRKNKLKSILKYDCNPIGEDIKKVKQKSVCTNTEFDKDGNKIVVKTSTDKKGRVYKKKYTFDKTTKKMIKSESFDYKNRPAYFYQQSDTKTLNINYHKGKETFKSIDYYKNKRVYKTEEYYKKKLKTSQEYEFNAKGLISKEIRVDKKGRKFVFVYEYGM